MNDEETRWSGIFGSHPVAGRINAERLAEALSGFPLQPVRDLKWLARAIQPAIYLAANRQLPMKGPAQVRDELQLLAAQTRALCTALFDISDEAEEAVWRFARSLPDASDDSANGEMAYFDQTVERLTGTMEFLERAAADAATMKGPSKKWERAADKDWRKWFAIWLSPAFEEGFGCRVTLSNANRTERYEHGHWADFYRRIMGLAFQRPGPENIRKVLADARRLTSRKRTAADVVRFPAGWFPK